MNYHKSYTKTLISQSDRVALACNSIFFATIRDKHRRNDTSCTTNHYLCPHKKNDKYDTTSTHIYPTHSHDSRCAGTRNHRVSRLSHPIPHLRHAVGYVLQAIAAQHTHIAHVLLARPSANGCMLGILRPACTLGPRRRRGCVHLHLLPYRHIGSRSSRHAGRQPLGTRFVQSSQQSGGSHTLAHIFFLYRGTHRYGLCPVVPHYMQAGTSAAVIAATDSISLTKIPSPRTRSDTLKTEHRILPMGHFTLHCRGEIGQFRTATTGLLHSRGDCHGGHRTPLLRDAILRRPENRGRLRRQSIGRARFRTEKYRPCHMDGPYLPAPHRIGCPGLVCSVAKHHQFYPNSFERKERASFISLYTTHNSRERLLKNYKKTPFMLYSIRKILHFSFINYNFAF